MILNGTLRQRRKINRDVYGILAIVILIFASILILLQLQHGEEVKREALINDYHLAVSKNSLLLISTIDRAKIWFRDREINRLKKDTLQKGTTSQSPIQIEFLEQDQINELIVELENPVKEIIRLQAKYADPEFSTVTILMEKAYEKVSLDLKELLSTEIYSSSMIDALVAPLLSSTIQLQRLHQHNYQEMYLSFENFQSEKRVQIISLVIALTIAGLVSVIFMLRHVQGTLTKLTNTQDDLQRERDFSENLITTAPVIILLIDLQGRIQHVNPYFEQLTGYKLDEIKGKDWISNFLPERDHPRIQELLHDSIQGISVRGNTNSIIIRDGTEREIEWYAETINDASGTTTGVLSIGMDVTERKQTEKEIEKYRDHLEELVQKRTAAMETARDEAERANTAKSQFLSHMSHELRTPMNAILGFAQLLKLDEDGLDQTQRGNVGEIMDAGQHLLNLINELLDLTRIETGKLEISMEDVLLDDVLQQSLTLIKPQADARHLSIINNISGKKYSVKADYTRLKQVMLNLLSNAVKYNQDHGRITLEDKLIDNKRLRIYVIDTGIGLSQKEIKQLFTSFTRLDKINNVEGTGIGLVITKNLVELMGGTIGVKSTPGEGCEFWVEFDLTHERVRQIQ